MSPDTLPVTVSLEEAERRLRHAEEAAASVGGREVLRTIEHVAAVRRLEELASLVGLHRQFEAAIAELEILRAHGDWLTEPPAEDADGEPAGRSAQWLMFDGDQYMVVSLTTIRFLHRWHHVAGRRKYMRLQRPKEREGD